MHMVRFADAVLDPYSHSSWYSQWKKKKEKKKRIRHCRRRGTFRSVLASNFQMLFMDLLWTCGHDVSYTVPTFSAFSCCGIVAGVPLVVQLVAGGRFMLRYTLFAERLTERRAEQKGQQVNRGPPAWLSFVLCAYRLV